MALVGEIFDAAMALMDELSAEGEARCERTEDYRHRTPAAVNMMLAELAEMAGCRGEWLPVEGLDDPVPGVGAAYARGAMAYGLAAALLVAETPARRHFSMSAMRSCATCTWPGCPPGPRGFATSTAAWNTAAFPAGSGRRPRVFACGLGYGRWEET